MTIDTDPLYAPGLKKKTTGRYFWRPSKRYLDAGYSIKTVTLEGRDGDGLDLERAAQCRALTRDMLDWFHRKTEGRTPGTWGFLIARYKSDRFSGYHRVTPATREGYDKGLALLDRSIAEVRIKDTDVEIMHGWIERMQGKGRSADYIHRFFTHFGLLITHGLLIKEPGCAEVRDVRSAMRLPKAAPRTTYATREQVSAIIEEADRRGMGPLALSVLLRFEYMLRGVDVYGQWVKDDNQQGGIRHHGRVWSTGLTWDMIADDLSSFSKVISKTQRRLPDAYTWSLIPSIRDRLALVPKEKRVGPVIVMEDGLPPRSNQLTKQFKQIVRDLHLPEELRISDLRPGGGTEARDLTDPMTLRDAMGHTQLGTTGIYMRARADHANKVVELRQRKAGR